MDIQDTTADPEQEERCTPEGESILAEDGEPNVRKQATGKSPERKDVAAEEGDGLATPTDEVQRAACSSGPHRTTESYFCEEDESEHTDDEEEEAELSEMEIDRVESSTTGPSEGKISIFEYNKEGLTRRSHVSLDGKDLAKDVVGSSGEDEGELFQCQTCKKVCATWTGFRSHLKSHSSHDAFSCQLCDKTFQTKHFVERHVRTFHKKERPYICRFCGKGFSTEWYCQKHESHHEKGTGPRISARDRTYSCAYCYKIFVKPRQLRMHESTHTGEKNYSCAICDKSFCYSSSLLKHHKCMHSDRPTSVCQYCDKLYSTEESLHKHNQYHVGVDQYKCRKCDEVFPDMLSLKRHGRSAHYDEVERPHQCSQCGKCFAHKSMLDVHERCHTGERPFDCHVCQKNFRQKSQLKTHLRSHSLERPYTCETCGKSYAESVSLQRHARTHTGGKLFTCSVCQKSFSTSHVLASHVKSHSDPDQAVKDSASADQDAEILALALEKFVQSMEKGGQHVGEGVDVTSAPQTEAGSDETQTSLSLTGACKIEPASKTVVTSQALPMTKLQTAQGPVEILSFSIEDDIHPIAMTEDAIQVKEVSMIQIKVKEPPRPTKRIETEATNDVSGSQSLEAKPEKNSIQLNYIPDSFISPSIYENPNMERIRHRYDRKPQRVEETLPSHDDVEGRNALVEMGVGSSKSVAAGDTDLDTRARSADKDATGVKVDPAEESEATDDEAEEEIDLEGLDNGRDKAAASKGNVDKVFESLSIFEIFGDSLICVRKVDIFEPKFHKKCIKCAKSFFSNGGYENHMKRHEVGKEMRYMCQFCGQHFTAKLSLKAHEAIHTGETLYKCEYCPREFRNYSSHRIHTATHTGLKPYLCQYCNKSFAQLSHVQRHERTHTGQKPYACEFCDKAFAEWGTWQRHTRTHTGEKPYVCPTCEKGFIVKFALRRHMKTHRDENGGPSLEKAMIYIPPKDVTATAMPEDVITEVRTDETEVSTEQLQATLDGEEVVHIPVL